ncbi:hypothetical protein GALMADRAFT_1350404 [Galerina marginata CBS 339.88]|uniref:Uncharacterized protein n=1 Tax=Galerina marginata (strain CBS 339.88) TaxID=685588 RepID=A0A067SS61_GALM3|nr:hypothetical protein GALMADRAFT_1350404 [Galerina marginata CBS 339.88]
MTSADTSHVHEKVYKLLIRSWIFPTLKKARSLSVDTLQCHRPQRYIDESISRRSTFNRSNIPTELAEGERGGDTAEAGSVTKGIAESKPQMSLRHDVTPLEERPEPARRECRTAWATDIGPLWRERMGAGSEIRVFSFSEYLDLEKREGGGVTVLPAVHAPGRRNRGLRTVRQLATCVSGIFFLAFRLLPRFPNAQPDFERSATSSSIASNRGGIDDTDKSCEMKVVGGVGEGKAADAGITVTNVAGRASTLATAPMDSSQGSQISRTYSNTANMSKAETHPSDTTSVEKRYLARTNEGEP